MIVDCKPSLLCKQLAGLYPVSASISQLQSTMAMRTRALRALPLLALLAASGCVAQQFAGDYDYEYGYTGGDFYNNEDGFADEAGGPGAAGPEEDPFLDEYGYYGDEDDQYYEYYGYYADDYAGYEDYYNDDYEFMDECQLDANNKPVLSNRTASCDIKITGVDKVADKLTGGIDGVYKLTSCHNGKAVYVRAKSPPGEERVLWYSNSFGDWDISKGKEPNNEAMNEKDILIYGGEMEHASVPLFVSNWHLASDLKSGSLDEADYVPISPKVQCADGKKFDPEEYNTAAVNKVQGPLLTDTEMDLKYKQLYSQYAKADVNPTVNFTFVVLMVMSGLTIVLAIPYFLLRKKGGKGSQSLGTSFAQMLQASKKKSSGHTH